VTAAAKSFNRLKRCDLTTWMSARPESMQGFTICLRLGPAAIAEGIRPRVVGSRYYDMMVNNVGSSEIFRAALSGTGCDVACHVMNDDQPRLYRRSACPRAR
jgi:hypothetical protein